MESVLLRAGLSAAAGGLPDRLRSAGPGLPGADDRGIRLLVHRDRTAPRSRGARGGPTATVLAAPIRRGSDHATAGPGRDLRRGAGPGAGMADPADEPRAVPGPAGAVSPQYRIQRRARCRARDPGLPPDALPQRRGVFPGCAPRGPAGGSGGRTPDRPLGPAPAPDA